MDTAEANQLLPSKPTEIICDARRLKYLLIGLPKWGKTTFLCSVPDSILLAFEEGHAFHRTHKVIMDSWDRPYAEKKEGWIEDDDGNRHTSFTEVVEAILASDKFQFVIIDTADMAAKMCLDYHYEKFKVAHAQDAGDYGKGWDICLTQPFRKLVGPIIKSGRGIGFITHAQYIERKIGASKITRMETTLPSQVQKFLHTQADVIMHTSFGRRLPGQKERDRVVTMDGSNEILAGSRIRGITMPRKYVVDPDHPWEQWAAFFDKKNGAKAVTKAEEDYETRMKGKDVEAASGEETISESVSEPKSDGKATTKVATTDKAKAKR